MRQRVHLPQMRGICRVLQGILPYGTHIHVLDRRVGELLRVIERGQTVEPVVRNFGHANVRLARVGAGLLRKMSLGKNLKQRCFAYLRQADNAGFHRGSF